MDKEFLIFSVSILPGGFTEVFSSEESTVKKYPENAELIRQLPKGGKFSFSTAKNDVEIRRVL